MVIVFLMHRQVEEVPQSEKVIRKGKHAFISIHFKTSVCRLHAFNFFQFNSILCKLLQTLILQTCQKKWNAYKYIKNMYRRWQIRCFPGYFETPLFRTFFHFTWDFEIAGFNCNSKTSLLLPCCPFLIHFLTIWSHCTVSLQMTLWLWKLGDLSAAGEKTWTCYRSINADKRRGYRYLLFNKL